MCGILCELCFAASRTTITKDEKVLQLIQNRGPNSFQTINIKLNANATATFCGAVLWMQGAKLTTQPLEDEKGILLYNGDIFEETWDCDVSDTQIIKDKLNQETVDSTEKHVTKVLNSLKGPFSIIYYDKTKEDLYFSRDRIGRSTMLISKTDESIVISSVLGRNYDCVEVPATYIYCLNLQNKKVKLLPRAETQTFEEYSIDTWLENLRIQQSLPDNEFSFDYDDSTVLTDHDAVLSFVEMAAKSTKCKRKLFNELLKNNAIHTIVLNITKLLEKSVKIRLKRQPNKCKDCLQNSTVECSHCTVGVLFSGGLDCTILALLADKYLSKEQSIDLINVAFKKDDKSTYDVPDRLTGRQSYEELKRICPLRKWTFREINVPKEELKEFQETTIADLVYPRQTILDESLGSALWFAARGKDHTTTSPCRVLLIGSGADELFGGYTRHRNAYKRHGWTGLSKELLLDWKRISFRNLSRDNRVICDHGRQPRMPYLDEDFTEYVLQLKPWFRCIPSDQLGPGIGDKLMLRLVAYNLGLTEAVTLPKRALQFGSRIANNKEKGSDISKTFWKCSQ